MYDFDIESVRISAVKMVSVVVAIRRLAKPIGLDTPELAVLEGQARDAAGELMQVEKLMVEDGERPLINQPGG